MPQKKFTVTGTHCNACKMLIEDILEDLNVQIESLEMDTEKKETQLVVNTELDSQKIIDEIQGEGDYTVTQN